MEIPVYITIFLLGMCCLIAWLCRKIKRVWSGEEYEERSTRTTRQGDFLLPYWSVKAGVVLLVTVVTISTIFLLSGCDNHKDEPSSVTGASSEKVITFPPFPAFPQPQLPWATEVKPTTETQTETTTTKPTPVQSGSEKCSYSGRYNGDRATWYCSKKMASYPSKITVKITGCFTKTVPNNGTRYQDSQLIVKQSDVSGRGMALVANSSCKSTEAYIEY